VSATVVCRWEFVVGDTEFRELSSEGGAVAFGRGRGLAAGPAGEEESPRLPFSLDRSHRRVERRIDRVQLLPHTHRNQSTAHTRTHHRTHAQPHTRTLVEGLRPKL
jgi:hypothetical protein